MADITDRAERMLATDCGQSLEELARTATDEDVARLIAVAGDAKESQARITRAVFLLGRMNKKQALEPVLAAVSRLEGDARIAAVDALGRLGGAKARTALIKLSSEADPQLRKFAARGLSRIGDKASLDRLRRIAEEDAEEFVRKTAQRQLERAK